MNTYWRWVFTLVGIALIFFVSYCFRARYILKSKSTKITLAPERIGSYPPHESTSVLPETTSKLKDLKTLTNEQRLAASRPMGAVNHQERFRAMDKVCPLLTESEEALLVEKYKASPKHLALIYTLSAHASQEKLAYLLAQFPNDPDVLALQLEKWNSKDVSKRGLAERLVKLQPNSAFAKFALAREQAKSGLLTDAANSISSLARLNNDYVTRSAEECMTKVALLQEVGRDRSGALARCLLLQGDNEAVMGMATFAGLKKLSVSGNLDSFASAISVCQKLADSQFASLRTVSEGRTNEVALLERMAQEAPENADRYFPDGVLQTARAARAELVRDLVWLSVAGESQEVIFAKASPELRNQLAEKFESIGVLSAYKWLYEVHPDLFFKD